MDKYILLTGVPAMASPCNMSRLVDRDPRATELARMASIKMRDAEKKTRDDKRETEIAWVTDQARKEIEKGGDPVLLMGVTQQYCECVIRLLQWQKHGIAMERSHTLNLNQQAYRDGVDERMLRKAVTRKLQHVMRKQEPLARKWGTPRVIAPDAIDLSLLTIEQPLLSLLTQVFGDEAPAVLRETLAKNTRYVTVAYDRLEQKRAFDSMLPEGLEVDVSHGIVRGVFWLKTEKILLRWHRGNLGIFDAPLPDTVMMACTGQRLDALIEHPAFTGDMEIARVNATRHAGKAGYVLTMKTAAVAIPADW